MVTTRVQIVKSIEINFVSTNRDSTELLPHTLQRLFIEICFRKLIYLQTDNYFFFFFFKHDRMVCTIMLRYTTTNYDTTRPIIARVFTNYV